MTQDTLNQIIIYGSMFNLFMITFLLTILLIDRKRRKEFGVKYIRTLNRRLFERMGDSDTLQSHVRPRSNPFYGKRGF